MNRVLNTTDTLWRHKKPTVKFHRAGQGPNESSLFSGLKLDDADHFMAKGTFSSRDGAITITPSEDFVSGLGTVLERVDLSDLPISGRHPNFRLRDVIRKDLVVFASASDTVYEIPNMEGPCEYLCRVKMYVSIKGTMHYDVIVIQVKIAGDIPDGELHVIIKDEPEPEPEKLIYRPSGPFCRCGKPGSFIECGKIRCDLHDNCTCWICSH